MSQSTTNDGRQFSAEIQGLRAIAVLSVLLFHIWPNSLPGGFVGVDVFFVISGFLITGTLLRELENDGAISLAGFYRRRIKRLLPAATVTILGVALAYRLLPLVTWGASSKSIAASTLYSQNWWLAHQATDYWAQDETPSTLQHFWSLSVEEQFYFVWPLILLVAAWIARRSKRSPSRIIQGTIAGVGLVSLAHCIALSRTDSSLAYFATTTRAWELALGGLLAASPGILRQAERASEFWRVLGLVMIIAVCFLFDETTRFPGYAALFPTVGAAAIIAAGSSTSRWSLSRLLRSRPCQFYGDISYSLYLWHWPVLLIYGQLTIGEISVPDGIIVFVLSGALAHQSKLLLEDPFRRRGMLDNGRWQAFAFALLCMASTLTAAWWIDRVYSSKLQAATLAESNKAESNKAESNKAESNKAEFLSADDRAMAALRAMDDMTPWYNSNCRGYSKTANPVPCVYGPSNAKFHVTLIGDSHAVHWEPAFIKLAEQRDWKFSIYAKTACSMGEGSVVRNGVLYDTCDAYRKNLMSLLERDKPNLVIISQSSGHVPYELSAKEDRVKVMALSLERSVRTLEKSGIRVFLLADTPWFDRRGPACLSDPKYTPGSCNLSRNKPPRFDDPVLLLEEEHPDIDILKMNQYICDQTQCKVIVDGMVVLRDSHHLTATFSASLAEELATELDRLLVGR